MIQTLFLRSLAPGGMALLGALVLATVASPPARAAADLARGAYLVEAIGACGNCHTPFGPQGPDQARALSGRLVEDNAAFTAYAPNITPAGPSGRWSDAELARAIREGIRPDGSLIGPPMPFALYRGLSDEDLAAMVAYLRSVPAVENAVPASDYRIPLPPAWGPPVEHVAAVPEGVTVAYGAYLAGPVAHCIECHSPMTPQGPDHSRPGAGGAVFAGPWGESVASNITPHEDGIARWSDAELAQMITTGHRPDGTPMLPPMGYGYYAHAKPEDISAIIAYLRALPPLATPEQP
ncbi:cytochrome c [Oceanicella sp. SM1341]|uniref:c-type cytochrome n=1 Tax=Oceanicella sp. SM1341 TaxID=1548889 RepID=UPI001E411EBC|nr:cytochrome c [Oceanicella sp. SM1341]